jgi:predicted nucleotidyltransferase
VARAPKAKKAESATPDAPERFQAALEKLTAQIREDRSVLAAILCGSLSHDTVWDKSDIDLVLVTRDGSKSSDHGLSLYADGINVHAILMERAKFRASVEGSIRNSFQHSFLAKGRLLYTHDETIARLCEQLGTIGARDLQIQLLNAGAALLAPLYKAHKWIRTRQDLEYTSLWILYAANSLAKVETLRAGLLADREVIPQALKLNPALFQMIYTDLLNTPKRAENVQAALSAIDAYLVKHTDELFGPVIDYLKEVGEARSATEIDDHFTRNFGVSWAAGVCEYLADRGLIGKVSLPVRLTKNSTAQVGELAFFCGSEVPDAW